ncbi:MAG: hypothetical protein RLZ91_919, partial [Bacteroidota bacterium]
MRHQEDHPASPRSVPSADYNYPNWNIYGFSAVSGVNTPASGLSKYFKIIDYYPAADDNG